MSSADPVVLIVDDDERNRKLAADLLRLAGFNVIEAATGGEAIALAVARLPDAVLMDLRLPDMDGSHAAQALGTDPRTSRLPVVALTATALEGDEDWLSASGFAGCIRKPIDIDEFPELVSQYLTPAGD